MLLVIARVEVVKSVCDSYIVLRRFCLLVIYDELRFVLFLVIFIFDKS